MKGGTKDVRISRKGAKDNRTRLVWSKYFKYTVEGREYYFKQKAYATYSDGWVDWEMIKKQTHKNAIKRGNECKEVKLEEDIAGVPTEYLIIIFSEVYGISKGQVKKIILKATAAIKHIKKNSTMGPVAEYRIFKRILEYQINQMKKEVQHDL